MVESMAVLSRAFLDEMLAGDPVEATRLGVHEYDRHLPNPDPDALQAAAQRRARLLSRWEALDPAGLSLQEQIDRRLAIAALRFALRQAAELQPWLRAPYLYAETVCGGLYLLMEREEGPAEERGAAVLARLRAVPGFLAQGQRNLGAATPPEWVEIAAASVRGGLQFLRESVPAWAAATLPPALAADVARAAVPAAQALAEFGQALAALPAAGRFAAGTDYYEYVLREYHLLPLSAAEAHEFGQEQMHAALAELERLASAVRPGTAWPELVAEAKRQHPAGPELLDAYWQAVQRGKAHVLAHDLVSIPAGERLEMVWTPPFLRSTLPMGQMGTASPFGPGLTSRFYITPLDESAAPARQAQQLGEHCYSFIHSIAFHEVYPGHHLQQVVHKQHPSALRRWFRSPLFLEGWGLYTEVLMGETGYFPEPAQRLFLARNALWRAVRVIVDTGLHTRGMSLREAAGLLHERVRQEPYLAEGEARRYLTHSNPTYPSCYLLGQVRILALREELRAREGAGFSLRRFHDRLLALGTVPLALCRAALLGEPLPPA